MFQEDTLLLSSDMLSEFRIIDISFSVHAECIGIQYTWKKLGNTHFFRFIFTWIEITAKPLTKPEILFHVYEIWKYIK